MTFKIQIFCTPNRLIEDRTYKNDLHAYHVMSFRLSGRREARTSAFRTRIYESKLYGDLGSLSVEFLDKKSQSRNILCDDYVYGDDELKCSICNGRLLFVRASLR